ncbi:lipocalin-like domain-containing protein [Dyadobacter sp. CY356]|uniref:lipocalin-like domain-containing protein n=1 Tax=Dyadobacter sp. CY356 TaxID=2906442 RepID=UPI001F2E62C9|nr:lipocalin-like domain-containing protein [Dyadobacter sp. CY356]MCF0054908.1 lipocalin-like domain-containing protein [Dyadobacter sp. CY356]
MKKLISITVLLLTATQIFADKPRQYLIPDSVEVIGLWTLVAVENINPDGSKTLPYGISPKGLLVFDKTGNYAIQILKASRPKVSAGDKNKATPEENAALVQGNNSHFGTYTINKESKTITFQIENAFYPNWEGTIQKRVYTLSDNELKYVVTQTTNGGDVTAVVIWKRKI